MRTITIATMQYAPGEPPANPEDMRRFLRDEFEKIYTALAALAAGHLESTHVAPAKPRTGDIRCADGTDWNPGSGQGFYGYYGAAWHFLG